MSDIVKGVLGGGWSLLVGWLLPSGLNVLLVGLLVLPQLASAAPVRWLRTSDPAQQGLAVLVTAVVIGLLLAAVQTPLYRLLEGYVGWRPADPTAPDRWWRSPLSVALASSRARHLRRKQILVGRLDLLELSNREARGTLPDLLRSKLRELRADRRLDRYAAADRLRSAAQRGLLREQVSRYPVDDDQVLPTRLGNAIRRLEEYGYDRYRLDSQRLWYEIYALAPEQARKQVDAARTTVDFLVCLLYGHLLVAAAAIAAASSGSGRLPQLLFAAVALVLLSWWWYRLAVVSTDDWAAAVRALVNTGRKPLAESLGLQLPASLADERLMWAAVSRLSFRPHDSRSGETDPYRASANSSPEPATRSTVQPG